VGGFLVDRHQTLRSVLTRINKNGSEIWVHVHHIRRPKTSQFRRDIFGQLRAMIENISASNEIISLKKTLQNAITPAEANLIL